MPLVASAPDHPEIREDILIIGEGGGDAALISHLCEDRGIQGFQIEDVRGNSKVQMYLSGLVGRKGVERLKGLIVVTDCDDGPDASFDTIRKQFKTAGIPYSDKPFTVAQRATSFSTYVLMLPFEGTQGRAGALETLLLPSALEHLAHHVPCLDAWYNCVQVDRLSKSHRDKAKLRALLAAAHPEDPNIALRFALGPTKNLIPMGHACFNPLADLLRSLLTIF